MTDEGLCLGGGSRKERISKGQGRDEVMLASIFEPTSPPLRTSSEALSKRMLVSCVKVATAEDATIGEVARGGGLGLGWALRTFFPFSRGGSMRRPTQPMAPPITASPPPSPSSSFMRRMKLWRAFTWSMDGEQGSDWGCFWRGFREGGRWGGVRATEVNALTMPSMASLRTTLWVRRKFMPLNAMPTKPGGDVWVQDKRKGSRRAWLEKSDWIVGGFVAEPCGL